MRRLLAWLCLAACAATAADKLSGRRAPGWNLPDGRLERHDLQDFRGKVVLIDFMRTHCPHCGEFAQVLEKVKAKFGAKIQVFAVVIYPPENQDTVLQFVKDNQITFPVLFDSSQMAASYLNIGPRTPQFEVPHLFLIDGEGKIRHDYASGEDTMPGFEQLSARVESLLGTKK